MLLYFYSQHCVLFVLCRHFGRSDVPIHMMQETEHRIAQKTESEPFYLVCHT